MAIPLTTTGSFFSAPPAETGKSEQGQLAEGFNFADLFAGLLTPPAETDAAISPNLPTTSSEAAYPALNLEPNTSLTVTTEESQAEPPTLSLAPGLSASIPSTAATVDTDPAQETLTQLVNQFMRPQTEKNPATAQQNNAPPEEAELLQNKGLIAITSSKTAGIASTNSISNTSLSASASKSKRSSTEEDPALLSFGQPQAEQAASWAQANSLPQPIPSAAPPNTETKYDRQSDISLLDNRTQQTKPMLNEANSGIDAQQLSVMAPDSSSPETTIFTLPQPEANPVTGLKETATTYQATISTPVHHSQEWSSEIGQHVLLMSKAGKQTAELHLNPSNLGPLQITLSLNADQSTSALFVAPHAETRQALNDALPQLREMFNTAGISLGQTNISSGSEQQNQQNARFTAPETRRSSRDNDILTGDSDLMSETANRRIVSLRSDGGRVDLFA